MEEVREKKQALTHKKGTYKGSITIQQGSILIPSSNPSKVPLLKSSHYEVGLQNMNFDGTQAYDHNIFLHTQKNIVRREMSKSTSGRWILFMDLLNVVSQKFYIFSEL